VSCVRPCTLRLKFIHPQTTNIFALSTTSSTSPSTIHECSVHFIFDLLGFVVCKEQIKLQGAASPLSLLPPFSNGETPCIVLSSSGTKYLNFTFWTENKTLNRGANVLEEVSLNSVYEYPLFRLTNRPTPALSLLPFSDE
jgi:hypothetical protein